MTSNSAPNDLRWLSHAIGLSRNCAPSAEGYSVGAVIVATNGEEIACGYSRESGTLLHAEESALGKLAVHDQRLSAATMYSTLEPCTERRSRPHSCTHLILYSGIRRVVIAWREPSLFVVDCQGVEQLREGGVIVTEIGELEAAARAVNGHLPGVNIEPGPAATPML